MTTCIWAGTSPGEIRVAVVRDGELLDYAIDRPGAPDGVGDLHRGRVIARMPALAGAFVALAGGVEGFLPDSEGGERVTDGAMLGVRITRAAQGGKGPRLTARLTEAEQAAVGRGGEGLLQRGPGVVERFAALHPDAPVLADDPRLVAAMRPSLGDRIAVARNGADDAVAAQIDVLAQSEVTLPGGGRLSIHPTPALVAIDVDLGGSAATRDAKTRHHLAFNRAVLPALARQIRLRNLSGAILVDLAGLSTRRRAALGPELAAALADDPLRPRLLGFTALGLAEIVRPRVHPPLHELLAGPHAAGLAALRAIATAVAADPAHMPALRASPALAAALDTDRIARADLAHRTGRDLILRADPSLPASAWRLEPA